MLVEGAGHHQRQHPPRHVQNLHVRQALLADVAVDALQRAGEQVVHGVLRRQLQYLVQRLRLPAEAQHQRIGVIPQPAQLEGGIHAQRLVLLQHALVAHALAAAAVLHEHVLGHGLVGGEAGHAAVGIPGGRFIVGGLSFRIAGVIFVPTLPGLLLPLLRALRVAEESHAGHVHVGAQEEACDHHRQHAQRHEHDHGNQRGVAAQHRQKRRVEQQHRIDRNLRQQHPADEAELQAEQPTLAALHALLARIQRLHHAHFGMLRQDVVRHGVAVGGDDPRHHQQQRPGEHDQRAQDAHAHALPVDPLREQHARAGRFAVQHAAAQAVEPHVHPGAHEQRPQAAEHGDAGQDDQHAAQLRVRRAVQIQIRADVEDAADADPAARAQQRRQQQQQRHPLPLSPQRFAGLFTKIRCKHGFPPQIFQNFIFRPCPPTIAHFSPHDKNGCKKRNLEGSSLAGYISTA